LTTANSEINKNISLVFIAVKYFQFYNVPVLIDTKKHVRHSLVYILFNCGKNIIKAYKNKQAANKNFKNIKTYVKRERAGTNVA